MLQNAKRMFITKRLNQILQNKLQFNINILFAKNLFFKNDIFHVQETHKRKNSLKNYEV